MTGDPFDPPRDHPHVLDARPDGWVRVDCHTHTYFSGDAVSAPDELAEQARRAGIDVLCVTDHHAIRGAAEVAACGVRVVVGEEIRTAQGELIGWFLSERIPAGLSVAETVSRIRAQGGLTYVPHPFDPMRRPLQRDALTAAIAEGWIVALEGFNAKTSLQHLNVEAQTVACDAGLPVGAGSDAHDPSSIGAAYMEMPDFDGPEAFLVALRAGRIVGHHHDRARDWRPRIIPGGIDPYR